MPGPPPYVGECKRAGDGAEHDDDVCAAGRYRGLCGVCRPIVAAAQKERREERTRPVRHRSDSRTAAIEAEVRARAKRRGNLREAVEELAPLADKLEAAIDERDTSTMRARAAVREFKEGLQLVGRVAQSLINTSPSRNGDEQAD